MRTIWSYIVLFILVGLFSFDLINTPPIHTQEKAFKRGEVLEYRIHYGFITAGYGRVEVSPEVYTINNRTCYKIHALGKSTATCDVFYKVRDNWGSYVDTATLLPMKSYKVVQENNYKHQEAVFFDHENKIAKTIVYGEDGNNTVKQVKINNPVQDIVSGYYFLRNIDFNQMKVGDIFVMKGFLDNEEYDLKVRYVKKDRIHTEFGKKEAILLSPIMPPNGLFNGENSIKVWISDDKNKVPLLIRAEMYVGGIEMELTSYKGLKTAL